MQTKTFQQLFSGLQRAYGLWDGTKQTTVKAQLTPKHYEDHLTGKLSLGVIPIREDSKCKFGAIDIDDHKKGGIKKKFDYNVLLKKIKFLKLPLTVFKSKSGGAHCYLFLDKFYPAKDVRHILKKFAYALGCSRDVEVFPKQDKLKASESGSYINLPYKGGNTRVLIDFEGKELNPEEAMKYAPLRVTNEANWSKFKLLDHDKSTGRNDRTFAYTSFANKHYKKDWKERVVEYNKIFNNPPIEDKELFSTVISSNEKKEYFDQEIIETPPTELVGHDIQEYRALDIPIPKFILERLFKERSINFLFGEKGKGKSMFAIGLAYAISHGLPFLNYKTPSCYPVILVDGEMDPYDLIEREKPFLETFGNAPKDYFHIVNWFFQKNQSFPEIREPIGQDLITKYCEKVKSLTGKTPFLILDNLRSLSNYSENDSDSWRPIGKWLLKLRGLGYTTLVLDHTGHGSSHMRGTSSKSDWANVCLKIESEGQKGGKIMKVKLSFDKARGLKPDETGDFVAQYDFAGNWVLGQSTKDADNETLFQKVTDYYTSLRDEVRKKNKQIKSDYYDGKITKKQSEELYINYNPPSQKKVADHLGIAVGKWNKLVKEYDKWSERAQNDIEGRPY